LEVWFIFATRSEIKEEVVGKNSTIRDIQLILTAICLAKNGKHNQASNQSKKSQEGKPSDLVSTQFLFDYF